MAAHFVFELLGGRHHVPHAGGDHHVGANMRTGNLGGVRVMIVVGFTPNGSRRHLVETMQIKKHFCGLASRQKRSVDMIVVEDKGSNENHTGNDCGCGLGRPGR